MSREGQPIYEAPKRKVYLNPEGLSNDEISTLTQVANRLFDGSKEKYEYALERCTFFAEPGYDTLVEIIVDTPSLTNPKIEGYDENPFNQHYWVGADLVREDGPKPVVFDPIFGYVGLLEKASTLLNQDYVRYYNNRRTVPPHVPSWEGGVRIKTISI